MHVLVFHEVHLLLLAVPLKTVCSDGHYCGYACTAECPSTYRGNSVMVAHPDRTRCGRPLNALSVMVLGACCAILTNMTVIFPLTDAMDAAPRLSTQSQTVELQSRVLGDQTGPMVHFRDVFSVPYRLLGNSSSQNGELPAGRTDSASAAGTRRAL